MGRLSSLHRFLVALISVSMSESSDGAYIQMHFRVASQAQGFG